MATVKYKDTHIAYTEAGDIGNPTLFFVHGSFMNKEYWSEQVRFFQQKYHVIAIDLPGHGQSPKGSDALTIQNCGDAVVSVIKDLNLKKVILIGHSLGADVILESAVRYPDKIIGFVVIDYYKNVGTPLPQEVVSQVLTGLEKDFQKTMETYVRTGLVTKSTDSEVVDRVTKDYQHMNNHAAIESITDQFKYVSREQALLEQLKFKVHLINVDYMPTNEAPLKASLKNGYELISIHGTSHFPMIEDSDSFNQTLEKVIAGIERK